MQIWKYLNQSFKKVLWILQCLQPGQCQTHLQKLKSVFLLYVHENGPETLLKNNFQCSLSKQNNTDWRVMKKVKREFLGTVSMWNCVCMSVRISMNLCVWDGTYITSTAAPPFTLPPPSLPAFPLSSAVACHKLKVETFQKLSLIITHKLIRKCFLTFSTHRRGEEKRLRQSHKINCTVCDSDN